MAAWLQDILRERFHEDMVLRPAGAGHCELAVPGRRPAIRIRGDFGLFEHSPEDLPCGTWSPPDARWLPAAWTSLPTPGMADPPAALIERDECGGHTLHYDVLGLAYWMLSRREEVGAAGLDGNQRYPAEASHAWRHGYLDRPIVDEWFEVLRGLMRATWPELPLHETRYELCLSHDVDTPARYAFIGPLRLARSLCADLFRERDRKAVLRAPWIRAGSGRRIDPRDPYNTFDWIMDRSEDAGLRSAFYFICGRTDRRRDGRYEPGHPAIVDLMQRIHARGHEIGLHPSYHCYRDAQALGAEARSLRRVCEQAGIAQPAIGARMHYLRWETPTTLHALEAAGLVYDTTLGYAKQPGFRCGTCHEYPAFDPVGNRALKLRIRPLIVMESTVIHGLRPHTVAASEARLLRLMAACRRVNGRYTLLWHNTLLEHARQRRLYERVLAHSRRGRP